MPDPVVQSPLKYWYAELARLEVAFDDGNASATERLALTAEIHRVLDKIAQWEAN
jgi:hypothetical protein